MAVVVLVIFLPTKAHALEKSYIREAFQLDKHRGGPQGPRTVTQFPKENIRTITVRWPVTGGRVSGPWSDYFSPPSPHTPSRNTSLGNRQCVRGES